MRTIWRIIPVILLISAVLFSTSCEITILADLPIPRTPSGLIAKNYDREVYLEWEDPRDSYVAGFSIFRNTSPGGAYTWIGDTGSVYYIDHDVTNAVTYYYTVTAYNSDNEESAPAPYVYTTPRPEGWSTMLYDVYIDASSCGFDFFNGEVVHYTEGDMHVLFDGTGNPWIVPHPQVWIADYDGAVHWEIDDVQEAPLYSTWNYRDDEIDVYTQHVYVLYIDTGLDGYYAKFRITQDLAYEWVRFDWAFQPDPDNPDL